MCILHNMVPRFVALLAEGVDRNYPTKSYLFSCLVALLAEGVDRNIIVGICNREIAGGRPPRGGRG